MRQLIRGLSAFIVTIVLTINSSITCMGYDVLNCYADVPSMVEKGKGFTVNLQVQCNSPVSVVMFTVVHGDGIVYKGCSVNDGSCGYIEKAYRDNTLTVMYINTKGISAVEKSSLAEIKFEAENYTANTDIQIYTSNAVSSDEFVLESSEGKLYGVEITEKVANSKPAQSKTLNSNRQEKTAEAVTAVEKIIPTQQADENTTKPAEKEKSVVTVEKSGDMGLFVAGVSFAVAVVILLLIGYKAGKHRANRKLI